MPPKKVNPPADGQLNDKKQEQGPALGIVVPPIPEAVVIAGNHVNPPQALVGVGDVAASKSKTKLSKKSVNTETKGSGRVTRSKGLPAPAVEVHAQVAVPPKGKGGRGAKRSVELVDVPVGGKVYEEGLVWEEAPPPPPTPTRKGKGILKRPAAVEPGNLVERSEASAATERTISFSEAPRHVRYFHAIATKKIKEEDDEAEVATVKEEGWIPVPQISPVQQLPLVFVPRILRKSFKKLSFDGDSNSQNGAALSACSTLPPPVIDFALQPGNTQIPPPKKSPILFTIGAARGAAPKSQNNSISFPLNMLVNPNSQRQKVLLKEVFPKLRASNTPPTPSASGAPKSADQPGSSGSMKEFRPTAASVQREPPDTHDGGSLGFDPPPFPAGPRPHAEVPLHKAAGPLEYDNQKSVGSGSNPPPGLIKSEVGNTPFAFPSTSKPNVAPLLSAFGNGPPPLVAATRFGALSTKPLIWKVADHIRIPQFTVAVPRVSVIGSAQARQHASSSHSIISMPKVARAFPFIADEELEAEKAQKKKYKDFLKANLASDGFIATLLSEDKMAHSLIKIVLERPGFEQLFDKFCRSGQHVPNPAVRLCDFIMTAEAKAQSKTLKTDPKVSTPDHLFWNEMLSILHDTFAHVIHESDETGLHLDDYNPRLASELKDVFVKKLMSMHGKEKAGTGAGKGGDDKKTIDKDAASTSGGGGGGSAGDENAGGLNSVDKVLVAIRSLSKDDIAKLFVKMFYHGPGDN